MNGFKIRRVTDGRLNAHEVVSTDDNDLWIAVVDARRSTELPRLMPLLREIGMWEQSAFMHEVRKLAGLTSDELEALRRLGVGAKFATKSTNTTDVMARVRARVPGAFRSLDHPIVVTPRVGLWYYVSDGRLEKPGLPVAPEVAATHQRMLDVLAEHLGSRKTGVARIKITRSIYDTHGLYVSCADGDLHRFVLSVGTQAYQLRREKRRHTKSSQYEFDRAWHGRVVGTQLDPIVAPPIDVAIVLQQLFDAALAYWEKHPE